MLKDTAVSAFSNQREAWLSNDSTVLEDDSTPALSNHDEQHQETIMQTQFSLPRILNFSSDCIDGLRGFRHGRIAMPLSGSTKAEPKTPKLN